MLCNSDIYTNIKRTFRINFGFRIGDCGFKIRNRKSAFRNHLPPSPRLRRL